MNRQGLDVEQQLRQLQEQQKQKSGAGSAFDDTQLSYVDWAFFYPVAGTVSVVAGATLLIIIAMLTRVFPRIEKRDAAQTVSLLASQASVISTTLTPRVCTFTFVAWVLLIALHAVFSAMRIAARMSHEGSLGSSVPLADFCLSISGAAFALELMSAVALWVYLLYFGGRLELGVVLSLPAFFPSLYESMLLQGDEPDRAAVWCTHFVFLASLFTVFAVATPWITREFQQARAQLNNHAQSALYRDRPEFKDLRTRARRDLQTRKEQ